MLRPKNWIEQELNDVFGNLFTYCNDFPNSKELVTPVEYFRSRSNELSSMIEYGYFKSDDGAEIQVTSPGIPEDCIEIDSSPNHIIVKAFNPSNEERKNADFYIKFRIDNDRCDHNKTKATYKDGLLKITIPIIEEKSVKKIPINTS